LRAKRWGGQADGHNTQQRNRHQAFPIHGVNPFARRLGVKQAVH